MALKFKMKDIGHEMFRGNNVTLSWLEYMEDGDVLYPGPKVQTLFSEDDMTEKYEKVLRNNNFLFIRNIISGKVQVICLTTSKPEKYKTKTMKQLLEAERDYFPIKSIPYENIHGVSNIQNLCNGFAFDAETKMYPAEHSLITLESSFKDEKFKLLLIHAFLVKDIFIPVKATFRITWGEEYTKYGVSTSFKGNKNKHVAIGCFGTLTDDLDAAYRHKDKGRLILLLMASLGNINLSDVCIWGKQKLFSSECLIHKVIKGGEEVTLTEENFNRICPEVNVDFSRLQTILKRHAVE